MATEKRMIEANSLKQHIVTAMRTCNLDVLNQTELEYCIDHEPTVDAVEVVRCKDCKFGEMCSIREAMALTDPNGYCCRGERRTDG